MVATVVALGVIVTVLTLGADSRSSFTLKHSSVDNSITSSVPQSIASSSSSFSSSSSASSPSSFSSFSSSASSSASASSGTSLGADGSAAVTAASSDTAKTGGTRASRPTQSHAHSLAGPVSNGGHTGSSRQTTKSTPSTPGTFAAGDSGSGDLLLAITNEYTDGVGAGYSHLTVGRVVEPARVTTLSLSLADGSDPSACYWLVEQISGASDNSAYLFSSDVAEPQGVTVLHTFPSPATYAVSATCTDADGGVHTLSTSVECVYVRRELRDLSANDAERFLTAFGVLQGTPTQTGRKLYGTAYRSLDDYVRLHLTGAGSRSHDKIHDGLGVLTQHASMTSDFERSLQSVDAAVAVPFWDYTRDAAVAKEQGEAGVSALFSSEWWSKTFGATASADHSIATSRFAAQQVSVAAAGDQVHNP